MPKSFPSRAVAIAAVLLLAPDAVARSQGLTPGTRVRVHSSQVVAPVIGSYQGMRRDTLVLIEDGESAAQWTFPSTEVTRLEVSRGMGRGNRGPIVRNSLYGAGIGAAAGVIVALLLEASSESEYNAVLSGAVGAAVGAGAGAAYGYRVEQEQWGAVAVPRRIGLIPSRGGVRLALRARF